MTLTANKCEIKCNTESLYFNLVSYVDDMLIMLGLFGGKGYVFLEFVEREQHRERV